MKKGPKTNKDIDINKLAEMQKENREIMENLKQATETPMFGQGNDNFAQAITEAGIKSAKATHEFNMKEIKAKLIADLCVEMTKNAGSSPIVRNIANNAREIAENALKNI